MLQQSPLTQSIMDRYLPRTFGGRPGEPPPTVPTGTEGLWETQHGYPGPTTGQPTGSQGPSLLELMIERFKRTTPGASIEVTLGQGKPMNYMDQYYPAGVPAIGVSPPPIDRRSHDFNMETARSVTPDRLPAPPIKTGTLEPEPEITATGTSDDMQKLREMYRRGDVSMQQILLGMADIPFNEGGTAGGPYFQEYAGFEPSPYGKPTGALTSILQMDRSK